MIRHLKRLGITTVQLMPVFAFISEPRLIDLGLTNFWGYNPVCIMAPDPRYAVNPANVINEFKTMVRELHRNDIAVILDVVFNHTGEGGLDGPVLSFKGLDNRSYYAFAKDESGQPIYTRYANVTGCGNSFNTDQQISLRLVMEAMLYWRTEMRVDGFRFDLGVTVGREDYGYSDFVFNNRAAFFKSCFANETLRQCLRIAEPWDLGRGGYQLGNFPLGWSEQNDVFRDTVRRFWRGDKGLLGKFVTCVMGSRDIFKKGQRSINASVNFVTYHDGFTLEDLVSYNYKHNELNGENNNDGTNENYSTNCGVEGPTDDPQVLRRRWQLKRNLIATGLLSQGVPHILAGDELSRTQHGNNNAYCQDNDISYVHWNINHEQEQFLNFVARAIRVLKSSSMLTELNLEDDPYYRLEEASFMAYWLQPSGATMTVDRWEDPELDHVLLYVGSKQHDGERWCLIYNRSDHEITFSLPRLPHERKWYPLLDTSEADGVPRRFVPEGDKALSPAFSMKLLDDRRQRRV